MASRSFSGEFLKIEARRVDAGGSDVRNMSPPAMADTAIERITQQCFIVERGYVVNEIGHRTMVSHAHHHQPMSGVRSRVSALASQAHQPRAALATRLAG